MLGNSSMLTGRVKRKEGGIRAKSLAVSLTMPPMKKDAAVLQPRDRRGRVRKRLLRSSFLPSSKTAMFRVVASLMLILQCIPRGTALIGLESVASRYFSLSNTRVRMTTRQHKLPASCTSLHAAPRRNRRSTADVIRQTDATLCQQVDELKRKCLYLLQKNDFNRALQPIRQLISLTERIDLRDRDTLRYVGEGVDDTVQAFTSLAFAAPVDGRYFTRDRVLRGTEAMQLQLSATNVPPPYNLIPKRTFVNALKALTQVNEVNQMDSMEGTSSTSAAAFRILQRLITGVGVRIRTRGKMFVHEKDFNMVLNAFSNSGKMDMAHRIVALQERTTNAPPLSPVAYSILLKGYGRLGDLQHVELVLSHAERNGIEPDTILLNSLIDAYVNCNAVDKAQHVFHQMRNPDKVDEPVFAGHNCPRPNRRTFNTVLKGLANSGALEDAVALSQEMEAYRMWDAVTTNTLVLAAVVAGDFDLAESVLVKHTTGQRQGSRQHPNVEAYTELLDGYCKAGQMEKALSVLQVMRQRGVDPNEFTYTCMIGGLGRSRKVEQAKKMMDFMVSSGLRVTSVTYNALMSGLLNSIQTDSSEEDLDSAIDEAFHLLRDMIHAGVRPNAVTVSVLVEALGRCRTPRVKESIMLVDKLEKQRIIPEGHLKVVTSLVQTCGLGRDIKSALEAFRKLQKPDLVAINAFLVTCCRCDRDKLAVETFDHYFRKKESSIPEKPDVISYSILISFFLKKNTVESRAQARTLYYEMKEQRGILPDTKLVDMILKAMVQIGQTRVLSKTDIYFVATVLRDAEKLAWVEGQLARRKRAVRAVLVDRLRNVWKRDEDLYDILGGSDDDDDLFKRKGWNKVDSGFRLWGPKTDVTIQKTTDTKAVDKFLESKGWNDFDSGFPII